MTSQDFAQLDIPDGPGVYFFKGNTSSEILYIGRATSLRDRVKSYFAKDLIETRGPLLVDMVARASTIEWQVTDSVLEAIILENNLIKANWPTYNTKDKDNRSYNYVIITDEDFPQVMLVRGREFEKNNKIKSRYGEYKIKKKFGPYPQAGLLNDALVIVRRIFPFRYTKAGKKLSPYHEAFYQSIGLSPEMSSPVAQSEYAKTIRNLSYFFQGRKQDLVKTLEKEMRAYARARKFEEASAVKHTLYALNHIQDVALIRRNHHDDTVFPTTATSQQGYRIEAYDIAHLSGKEVVGVMVVIDQFDGGYEPNKNEYRKFKLSKNKNDDTGNLREILTRRLQHPEWRTPNLIVIDGGQNQLNAARAVLTANPTYASVPLVSVIKDARHKAREILVDGIGAMDFATVVGTKNKKTDTIPKIHKNLVNFDGINEKKIIDSPETAVHSKAILLANAEAHRFAIAYHRYRRRRATGI